MKIDQFGKSLVAFVFVACVGLCGTASAQSAMTVDQAKLVIAPFYDALNDPAKKNTRALVRKATAKDWISCGGPEDCRGQEKTIASFSQLGRSVPDLKWQLQDVIVSGNDVVVRGEFTGTPSEVFAGQANRQKLQDHVDRYPHDQGWKDGPLLSSGKLGRCNPATHRKMSVISSLELVTRLVCLLKSLLLS